MAETLSPGRRSSDAKVKIAPSSGGGVEASPSFDEAFPHPSSGKRTARAIDRPRIDGKLHPWAADGIAHAKSADLLGFAPARAPVDLVRLITVHSHHAYRLPALLRRVREPEYLRRSSYNS